MIGDMKGSTEPAQETAMPVLRSKRRLCNCNYGLHSTISKWHPIGIEKATVLVNPWRYGRQEVLGQRKIPQRGHECLPQKGTNATGVYSSSNNNNNNNNNNIKLKNII
jgi:hypothetical protein